MWWVVGGAAAGAVIVAAVAAVYLGAMTQSVTVDGKTIRVKRGSIAGAIAETQLKSRRDGNLVSAKDHHVLKAGGGGQPYLTVNGQKVAEAAVVAPSAVIVSSNGTDVVEQVRVNKQTISPPTVYQGAGPIETVVSTGTAGVREVVVGVVSKQVVSKKVQLEAKPRVVKLSSPYAGAKVVALTFDDGPWPSQTLAILDILRKNGVKATFFEIGRQARQMPSVSRAVANAGMEMGNHTETHPLNLGHLSAAGVKKEIVMAQYDISHASGKTPTFFRPPGGNTTAAMYPVLKDQHLGWVQWDIDTDDWKEPPASVIQQRVLRAVRPGSVVLMHDGGGNRSHTIQALPGIIKALKAGGYSFVTIDQLPSVPHRMG